MTEDQDMQWQGFVAQFCGLPPVPIFEPLGDKCKLQKSYDLGRANARQAMFHTRGAKLRNELMKMAGVDK